MRTQPPEIKVADRISITAPEIIELNNKCKFYVFNANHQPILQLKIVFFAGNWFENKNMQANLTAALLKNGTSKKSSDLISETIDYYGASLKVKSNANLTVLTLSCLSKHLKPLLELIKEILTDSVFPENALQLKLKQKTSELKQHLDDVGFVSSKQFNQVLFGKENPYGYFPKETDFLAITQDDLLSHYKAHYIFNERTILIGAGDFNDQAKAEVQNILGSITEKQTTPVISKAFNASKEYMHQVNRANSHQSGIRIGMPTIDKKHKDYIALNFLTLLFGGFFGSRLMSNIREDKGYTYGIYAFINTLLHNSYFCISTEAGIQYTNNVLNEIKKEINRLKTEPVDDAELMMVKNYYNGQVLRAFDGVFNTANQFLPLLLFNETLETVNENIELVRSINAKQLKQLAEKYYNFDTMFKVIVG